MDNVKDKAIYGVLAVILLITSLTLILQMHDSFRIADTVPYTPDMSAVTPDVVSEEESPLLKNKNLSRQLEGAVILLAEDGTYLRMNVVDEGMFSIGVTGDTVIKTESGVTIALADIEPFAEALLEVIPLEDGQMYDFLAVSVTVDGSEDITLEEQAQRAQERLRYIAN